MGQIKYFQGKNDHIEGLRFLAAFLVVCFHVPSIGIGQFGVDIFFVISGLVMMISTAENNEDFFKKRLIRIIPTYYIFTTGVFVIALVMPSLLNNTSADFIELLKSFLFIPFNKNGTGHYPILFLGWTLNYEMYFYLIFAVALKINHKFRGEITTIFLAVLCVISSFSDTFFVRVYSNTILAEFILGIILYEVLTQRRLKNILFLLFFYLIPLSANSFDVMGRGYACGVPAFFLCLATMSLRSYYKIPKTIVFLGGASYALYLTHPYVIQLFDKITGWFDGSLWMVFMATIVSFLLSFFTAAVIYVYFERPIQKYLRHKLIQKK